MQQARDYEADLDRAKPVEKEKLEEALMEKFEFARQAEINLAGLLDMYVALPHKALDTFLSDGFTNYIVRTLS